MVFFDGVCSYLHSKLINVMNQTPVVPLSPAPFPMSPLEEEEETIVRDENCALPSKQYRCFIAVFQDSAIGGI